MPQRSIKVWHDETSDEHGWIVSIEDSDGSDTISVSEDQHEADYIGLCVAAALRFRPRITRQDLKRTVIRARIEYAHRLV